VRGERPGWLTRREAVTLPSRRRLALDVLPARVDALPLVAGVERQQAVADEIRRRRAAGYPQAQHRPAVRLQQATGVQLRERREAGIPARRRHDAEQRAEQRPLRGAQRRFGDRQQGQHRQQPCRPAQRLRTEARHQRRQHCRQRCQPRQGLREGIKRQAARNQHRERKRRRGQRIAGRIAGAAGGRRRACAEQPQQQHQHGQTQPAEHGEVRRPGIGRHPVGERHVAEQAAAHEGDEREARRRRQRPAPA
jgi:hypothetical protein